MEKNRQFLYKFSTPDEEGFTASGALRMGVSEMTRFGFGEKEFETLAGLIADCVLRGKAVGEEAARLRAGFLEPRYCFTDRDVDGALEALAGKLGL